MPGTDICDRGQTWSNKMAGLWGILLLADNLANPTAIDVSMNDLVGTS